MSQSNKTYILLYGIFEKKDSGLVVLALSHHWQEVEEKYKASGYSLINSTEKLTYHPPEQLNKKCYGGDFESKWEIFPATEDFQQEGYKACPFSLVTNLNILVGDRGPWPIPLSRPSCDSTHTKFEFNDYSSKENVANNVFEGPGAITRTRELSEEVVRNRSDTRRKSNKKTASTPSLQQVNTSNLVFRNKTCDPKDLRDGTQPENSFTSEEKKQATTVTDASVRYSKEANSKSGFTDAPDDEEHRCASTPAEDTVEFDPDQRYNISVVSWLLLYICFLTIVLTPPAPIQYARAKYDPMKRRIVVTWPELANTAMYYVQVNGQVYTTRQHWFVHKKPPPSVQYKYRIWVKNFLGVKSQATTSNAVETAPEAVKWLEAYSVGEKICAWWTTPLETNVVRHVQLYKWGTQTMLKGVHIASPEDRLCVSSPKTPTLYVFKVWLVNRYGVPSKKKITRIMSTGQIRPNVVQNDLLIKKMRELSEENLIISWKSLAFYTGGAIAIMILLIWFRSVMYASRKIEINLIRHDNAVTTQRIRTVSGGPDICFQRQEARCWCFLGRIRGDAYIYPSIDD